MNLSMKMLYEKHRRCLCGYLTLHESVTYDRDYVQVKFLQSKFTVRKRHTIAKIRKNKAQVVHFAPRGVARAQAQTRSRRVRKAVFSWKDYLKVKNLNQKKPMAEINYIYSKLITRRHIRAWCVVNEFLCIVAEISGLFNETCFHCRIYFSLSSHYPHPPAIRVPK